LRQKYYEEYTLVNADGTTTQEDVLTLQEMQNFVGGHIEQVGNVMCNDDGIRLNLPRNVIYPRILGNVIIINR